MALFNKKDEVKVASESGSHESFINEQKRIQHELNTHPLRKDGETQHQYNTRIPVALQPDQPSATHSYLGKKL